MSTPLRGIVGGAHFLLRLFHHGDTPQAAKDSTRLVMDVIEPLIGPATDVLDAMLKPKPVMPDPPKEPVVIVIDTYGEDVTTKVSKPKKRQSLVKRKK